MFCCLQAVQPATAAPARARRRGAAKPVDARRQMTQNGAEAKHEVRDDPRHRGSHRRIPRSGTDQKDRTGHDDGPPAAHARAPAPRAGSAIASTRARRARPRGDCAASSSAGERARRRRRRADDRAAHGSERRRACRATSLSRITPNTSVTPRPADLREIDGQRARAGRVVRGIEQHVAPRPPGSARAAPASARRSAPRARPPSDTAIARARRARRAGATATAALSTADGVRAAPA